MDDQVQQDAPVETPVVETPAVTAATTDEPDTQSVAPVATEQVVETESDDEPEYAQYELPKVPQLDFSDVPMGDDNLIDPQVLAGQINSSMAAVEERATLRAQQMFQEQRTEEKSWDKAYEKYPELKENKELRDFVHQARLGEVTDKLSRSQDASSVKLPTPMQVAEKLFKYADSKKLEGMKQANENTVIQESAHVETSGRRTDDSSDARAKAFQNINNPNKELAKKARSELLSNMLFGNSN